METTGDTNQSQPLGPRARPSSARSACATACRASPRIAAHRAQAASGCARPTTPGQREIEVGSFVPARLLPQLADTAEVLAFAKTLPGLKASVLVPNLKGAERAIDGEADADAAAAVGQPRAQPGQPAQDARRGGGGDRAASARCAMPRGSRTLIEVGMSTAFGCTIQGRVEPDEVLRLVKAVLDAGADRVGLADTVGYADPRDGAGAVRAVPARSPATG